MYLIIIAVVKKVDERRLIKVEMEILGELQANDRMENQATTKTNEIGEEAQTELLDQCTEVRFATNLSGGFTTIAVINPPERKVAKHISVQCPDDCRDRNCLITDHHD